MLRLICLKKRKGMTLSAHFQVLQSVENSTFGAAAHVLRANGQLISPEAGSRSAEPNSVPRLSPRAGSSLEREPTRSDALCGLLPEDVETLPQPYPLEGYFKSKFRSSGGGILSPEEQDNCLDIMRFFLKKEEKPHPAFPFS